MQEYKCSECGYRKLEREMMDFMAEIPMYSGFGGGYMQMTSQQMNWGEDVVCPNCGKASSWHPNINNSN